MYTATDGIPLPTTVTGSWPRPSWYTENLWGRTYSSGLVDLRYREQATDAVKCVVSDQERAGLDILTNGDFHHDNDLGGRSWAHYNIERLAGIDENREVTTDEAFAFPGGTLLHEIFAGWRYPLVTDKLRWTPRLEFDHVWRVAHAHTDRPVKIGTISSGCLGLFLSIEDGSYPLDKRDLMWDLAGAINLELRRLVAAGCKVIQIEDPPPHLLSVQGVDAEYLKFMVDLHNHEVDGLDDAEVWVHTCWGNPMMQRAYLDDISSYRETFDLYLDQVRGDVLTVEMKDRGFKDLELFASRKGHLPKKVAVGVVSHRNLQAETPEQVAESIRLALNYIDPYDLILSSDCGFGREGMPRSIAFYKAAALAQGRDIVLRELGLDERHAPIANEHKLYDRPRTSETWAPVS